MKTITKIFSGLAVLGALASCQMYEIDTQMTPDKAAASISMVCSAVDTYNLPAQNPGKITFNVSSNTPWTITLSSGADWLSVTPASSASSTLISDVVVTAQNNTGATDRSATLTLRGENIVNARTITVKQSRASKLFVTPTVKDYSAAGGPLSFSIQTNQPWEVRSSESWLTFNVENGEPDPEGHTITIIATAAASEVLERTATVTVVAGDEEESFEVAQKGVFVLTELSESFPTAGGTMTFSFKTDLPWSVSSDKNWISFDATEGTGDGKTKVITATAGENEGAVRKAVVTVKAGDTEKTFEASQKGQVFEIVPPASTEIKGEADVITLNVNSTLTWEPATDVEGWTVEKVNATSFTVKTTWNGLFIPKKGKVSINGPGGAKDELELTQDVNFTFDGNCTVLEDGSVKIASGAKSRVSLKNNYKHITFILKMGEVHFDDQAQFWLVTHAAGGINDCEIENRISLPAKDYATSPESGNIRLRANAAFPDGSGKKASGSAYYHNKITGKDVLNTLTEYRVDFVSAPNPDAEHPERTLRMAFTFNGELYAEKWVDDIFDVTTQDMAAPYWFGFYDAVTDGTWYIVKSCDVTLYD